MRYPDKFSITPVTKIVQEGDIDFEVDESGTVFTFDGRIRLANPDESKELIEATHIIYTSVLDYTFQKGILITDIRTGKGYELLLPYVGQYGTKLWLALT